jgi:hypothetical protein
MSLVKPSTYVESWVLFDSDMGCLQLFHLPGQFLPAPARNDHGRRRALALVLSRNRNWLPLLGPRQSACIGSAQPSSAALPSAGREGSEGRARGTACIHATRGSSEFEPSSLPVPQPQGNGQRQPQQRKRQRQVMGESGNRGRAPVLSCPYRCACSGAVRFLQDASVHSFSFSKAEQSAELGISVPRQFSTPCIAACQC